MFQLLLVEDDDAFSRRFDQKVVAPLGDAVATRRACDVTGAKAAVQALLPDLVISDLSLPAAPGERPDDGAGERFLAWLEALEAPPPALVLSGQDLSQAIGLVRRRRVVDFLSKSSPWDELAARVEGVVTGLRQPAPAPNLGGRADGPLLVGDSPAMRAVRDLLDRAAATDATVLLRGETGTGKSLAARALHARSPRRDGPFVAVNCGALPPDLVEAELFGHCAGAFTGAQQARKGRFRAADGGTLFLDELGEVPPATQAKLLRVLEERQVEPLGTDTPVPVDVRLVAATHRDLEAMVAEGTFRQDLLYRLRVVSVEMPSLRARPEDLEDLVEHLLAQIRPPKQGLTPEAWALLRSLPFPGNIRELSHVLEAAAVRTDAPRLGAGALGASLGPASPSPGPGLGAPEALLGAPGFTLKGWLTDQETALTEAALRQVEGNVAAAAKLLGEKPDTLRTRLRRSKG